MAISLHSECEMCYNVLMSKNHKHRLKLSLRMHDSFAHTLIVVFGVVLVWRGLWNLIDIYIFPGNPVFSSVVTVVLGVFLLYLPDGSLDDLR